MAREIEGCMFLEFAKGDACIIGLLSRVSNNNKRNSLTV